MCVPITQSGMLLNSARSSVSLYRIKMKEKTTKIRKRKKNKSTKIRKRLKKRKEKQLNKT